LSRASWGNVKSFPNELSITDENRKYTVIEKLCETLSLSGNIGEIEDGLVAHVHISL